MKIKQTIIAVCCILAFCFLSACQSGLPDAGAISDKAKSADGIIYKSENVQVSLIDSAARPAGSSTSYEWLRQSQEEAYTRNTVILTGTVSNVRECVIDINGQESSVFNNMTIFDVTVDEVLSCRSDAFPDRDVITVGAGYNTVTYTSEIPQIKEGSSYLMFCHMARDERGDITESCNYVDCWISNVRDLFCEKVGDYYLTNDYFSDLSSTGNLADTAGITDQDISNGQADWSRADASTARRYFEDIVRSSPVKDAKMRDAALDALMVVYSRLNANNSAGMPSGHWLDIEISYLIDCETLEEHVRATATKYGG